MDAWRAAVVEEAKSWLGTPWVHNARIKGAGVDCAQLLIGVFSGAGVIEAFDTGEYPVDWMLHREEERFLGWLGQYMVPTDATLPGDVAIWKFGRCFAHAAVVTEWPVLIHAFRKEKGVVWGDATLGDLSRHERLLYTRRM
jgi:cell wall-associated NlpC family hydrolase